MNKTWVSSGLAILLCLAGFVFLPSKNGLGSGRNSMPDPIGDHSAPPLNPIRQQKNRIGTVSYQALLKLEAKQRQEVLKNLIDGIGHSDVNQESTARLLVAIERFAPDLLVPAIQSLLERDLDGTIQLIARYTSGAFAEKCFEVLVTSRHPDFDFALLDVVEKNRLVSGVTSHDPMVWTGIHQERDLTLRMGLCEKYLEALLTNGSFTPEELVMLTLEEGFGTNIAGAVVARNKTSEIIPTYQSIGASFDRRQLLEGIVRELPFDKFSEYKASVSDDDFGFALGAYSMFRPEAFSDGHFWNQISSLEPGGNQSGITDGLVQYFDRDPDFNNLFREEHLPRFMLSLPRDEVHKIARKIKRVAGKHNLSSSQVKYIEELLNSVE